MNELKSGCALVIFYVFLGYFIVIPLIKFTLESVSESFTGIGSSTVYIKTCFLASNPYSDLFECEKKGGNITIQKVQFRVDFSRQAVVRTTLVGVRQLEQCIVLDSANWNCESANDWYKMRESGYTEGLKQNARIDSYHVGWPAYWIYQIKLLIGIK